MCKFYAEVEYQPMYVFLGTGVGSDCLCENRERSQLGWSQTPTHTTASHQHTSTPHLQQELRVSKNKKKLQKKKKGLFDLCLTA